MAFGAIAYNDWQRLPTFSARLGPSAPQPGSNKSSTGMVSSILFETCHSVCNLIMGCFL